ncbi:unnamed protein product [Nezara viridula]|uniref:Uncharacterized protein n=1 Tax=Nezara viridula TaxID=85310 RepID=A0A9P0GUV0_NEZVI|nr:unnamed protein product [Nezara viridula]
MWDSPQSSPIQDGEPLGSNDNEHLDGSYTNEEVKETTDEEKDFGTIVILEESMTEIINDIEASEAEKEENIDEEKEILIEKEDESRCDDINPDFPVKEETDVDNISEDEKGESLTDITTNDRPSKPKNKVIDIRDLEEIKADKGPYRIKQKIVVIDPG